MLFKMPFAAKYRKREWHGFLENNLQFLLDDSSLLNAEDEILNSYDNDLSCLTTQAIFETESNYSNDVILLHILHAFRTIWVIRVKLNDFILCQCT